jgi:hypothetical protein
MSLRTEAPTRHEHPALKILSAPQSRNISPQATTDISIYFASENFSTNDECGLIGADASASQHPLCSLEPVKIAFRWHILNDLALVRNELRIKASCYTDISIFSVAFEARIWLYVGLCCDAGGLDSVPVPAVATHRSFPTRMN